MTTTRVQSLAELANADATTFRESVRGRNKWYQYSIALTTIGAGTFAAPLQVAPAPTIAIEQSSHFFAREITGVALLSATNLVMNFAAVAQPRLQITDTGAGISLFDQPLLWDDIVGVAERPLPLPMPYLFHASAVVRVDLYNAHTAGVALQVTLGGVKVFLS